MSQYHPTHVSVAVPVAEAVAEAVAGAVVAAGAEVGVPGVVVRPVRGPQWEVAGAECPCGKLDKSAASGTRIAGRTRGRCGRREAFWHLTRERICCWL